MIAEAHSERRGHLRFDMASTGARLGRIRNTNNHMDMEGFSLANLSQSGMCIQGNDSLEQGAIEHFVMDLTVPSPSMVLVRAEVKWAEPRGEGRHAMGIRFLDSSKAWLGPDDSGCEDI